MIKTNKGDFVIFLNQIFAFKLSSVKTRDLFRTLRKNKMMGKALQGDFKC